MSTYAVFLAVCVTYWDNFKFENQVFGCVSNQQMLLKVSTFERESLFFSILPKNERKISAPVG
jgi:hypothetical protein